MASLIKRSNGIYYLVTYINGKRVWQSTNSTNKTRAIQFLGQREKEASHPKVLTLNQFRTQYLTFARTNLAPSTVALYDGAMKTFIKYLGDQVLTLYSPQMIEQYKTLQLQHVSPVKANIDFRSLKSAFSTAVNWGLIPENPFRKCKPVRIPQIRPQFLTPDDFQKLLSAISYDWFKDIVMFAVSTMMRVGEIVNLQWCSIDIERRLIHVENTDVYR